VIRSRWCTAAGACGFLLKHAPPEELLLRVRDRVQPVVYGYENGLAEPGAAE
jgi:hypothetical protein